MTGTTSDDRRAYAYLRVSSQQQADHGASLQADQPAVVSRIAESNRLTIVRTYSDVMTGSTHDRPGLVSLRADQRVEGVPNVIIAYIDRATRAPSWAERGELIDWLADTGVTLYSSDGIYDLSQDASSLMLALQWYQSSDWLKKHRRRLTDSWQDRKERGVHCCGSAPFGLRRVKRRELEGGDPELLARFQQADAAAGRLVPSLLVPSAQAPVLLEIVERFLAGERPFAIARSLNERGVRSATGRAWSEASVLSLLGATAIGGMVEVEEGIPASLRPAVNVDSPVPMEMWLRVVALRMAERRLAPRSQGSTSVLAGLLVCGACGGKLGTSGRKARAAGPPNIIFRCRSAVYHTGCKQPGIAESRILPGLAAELRRHLRAEDVPPEDDERDAEDLAREDRLRVLRGQLDRLTDLYVAGDLSRGGYDDRKARLDAEIAELLAASRPRMAVPDVTDEMLDELLCDRDALRALARTTVARIYVQDGQAAMPPEWL